MCCVSLFSAYPVIGRSDMDKLQGKGNHQNYDAHIVPVLPADSSNPRELNYFPCEAPALQQPYTGRRFYRLLRRRLRSFHRASHAMRALL